MIKTVFWEINLEFKQLDQVSIVYLQSDSYHNTLPDVGDIEKN